MNSGNLQSANTFLMHKPIYLYAFYNDKFIMFLMLRVQIYVFYLKHRIGIQLLNLHAIDVHIWRSLFYLLTFFSVAPPPPFFFLNFYLNTFFYLFMKSISLIMHKIVYYFYINNKKSNSVRSEFSITRKDLSENSIKEC